MAPKYIAFALPSAIPSRQISGSPQSGHQRCGTPGCAAGSGRGAGSRAGLLLADEGRATADVDALRPRDVRRLNATLLTCGTYDGAGDFAYTVGVPAKSAVSGAILAIVPRRCAVCVWSPRLDASGCSVAGWEALQVLVERLGLSLF